VKRYRVTVDGRTYEVEIDDPRAQPITARVLGEVFKVEVDRGVHAGDAIPAADASERGAEPVVPMATSPEPGQGRYQLVTAPIPGMITALTAGVGQAVRRGDGLLTIEAMKMFNVIRSQWAGTVTAVHVSVGKHVAYGEPLVSLSTD
jgi:glutaconyl-CoA/methylmalonyl-CoA decarboxylase subunit gamma